MTIDSETPVTFAIDQLALEGALHAADGATRSAVVLHPHPQYGGDMDNHVVLAICRALAACGAATLRFNFRGTGGSEGAHDGGGAEVADARAAIALMRDQCPGLPVVLAGYSFGAQVAASAAAEAGLDALVLVSPPLAYAPLPALPAGLRVLAVGGASDRVCPPERLDGLREHGAGVVIVDGVDHGWFGGVQALGDAIRSFLS